MPKPDHPAYSEMLRLRTEELLTLKQIGQRFGVSRERVRQIIGNTGNVIPMRRRQEILKYPNLTNSELAEKLGTNKETVSKYRADTFHMMDGRLRDSSEAKLALKEILESKGFFIDLLSRADEYDLTIDGRVNGLVRLATKHKTSPSLKNVSPKWVFNDIGLLTYDFLFCIVIDDVFVVPRTAIPQNRQRIEFCWPTLRPEIGKFQKFLGRYDLVSTAVMERKNAI